jgi:hypothetical protein
MEVEATFDDLSMTSDLISSELTIIDLTFSLRKDKSNFIINTSTISNYINSLFCI